MSLIDWLIVVLLNGSIVLFAIIDGRDTKTSSDWFLARRSLPWWMVGLSMYATAIDASDLVADSGGAYSLGLSMFAINWVGVITGWFFMSQFIALRMYRAGMYTNAEYLEARYTPAARMISAVIQVIYRTVVLGIIGTTVFITLTIVANWSPTTAWGAVLVIAFIATIYTVVGGLRSVALTDAMQSLIMLAASFLLFAVVFHQVGGWGGVEAKLNAKEPGLADRVLSVGVPRIEVQPLDGYSDTAKRGLQALGGTYDEQANSLVTHTPAWVMCCYFVIAGMLLFFLDIIGAFVVPLLTVYLMGALTRVHRQSAVIGMLVGVTYGVLFLLSGPIAEQFGVAILRDPLSNKYAVAPVSMLLTAGTMVMVSLIHGWEPAGELREMDESGWLSESRHQLQDIASASAGEGNTVPLILGALLSLLGIVLTFVVFW